MKPLSEKAFTHPQENGEPDLLTTKDVGEAVKMLKEEFITLTFCNDCNSSLSICKCENDNIRKAMWTHAVIGTLDKIFGTVKD